jgi:hypothetical protein
MNSAFFAPILPLFLENVHDIRLGEKRFAIGKGNGPVDHLERRTPRA